MRARIPHAHPSLSTGAAGLGRLFRLSLLAAGLWLAGGLAPGPAFAAGNATEAEHNRLSDEIEKLANRQVWTGVERKFRDLERLGTEPTYDDLMYAATAARELGDVQRSYDRLKVAVKLKGSKEIVDWLWDIDNNYGSVELLTVPSRSTELEIEEMPFDPNQRKAVEAAQESVRRDGIFVGMLPRGAYRFASQGFTVEPGVSARIEVSPRMRRQGIIDPVIIYRDEYGNPTTVDPSESASDPPSDASTGASSPEE